MANQPHLGWNKIIKDDTINFPYKTFCNFNKIRGFRWKSSHIVQKLCLREICGRFKKTQHDLSSRFFDKLPRRLIFRLCELVDESVLEAGHVFLGFTKDGQFVLSYTLQLEADENTIYPCYIYKLQWWQFVPYQPLKKISEVRLFGEENITQDLFVAICEWPTDYSYVLVYGCSRILLRLQALNQSLEDTAGECYMTITAIPRRKCKHLLPHSDEENTKHNPSCICHSLTVHTKFSTVPPFPQFCPKICLKIDGTVIINTGDYLIVLTIIVDSRINGDRNEEKETADANCQRLSNSPSINQNQNGIESLNVSEFHADTKLFKDTEQLFSDKLDSRLLGNNKYSDKHDFSKLLSHSNSSLAGICIFEQNDNTKVVDSESLISENYSQNTDGCNIDIKNFKKESKCSDGTCHIEDVESETIKENLSPHLSSDKLSPLFLQCFPDNNRISKRNMLLSPTMPSSSEESSVTDSSDILITPGIQPCVTKSVHTFVDVAADVESNESGDDSSATNGYHSYLPMEVHGSGYKNLICISKAKQHKYKDYMHLCICQLNLDVEQFIHEVAHTLCSSAGKKYIAFNDYDIQIIDIRPDTGEALIMISVLLQATVDTSCRALTKLFETGLKFLWNIKTGDYRTIDVKDLIEIEQKGSKQKISSHCWNPALEECQELQKHLFIPSAPFQNIHVLTNAAVLKGSSLKIIVDPNNYVAIAL